MRQTKQSQIDFLTKELERARGTIAALTIEVTTLYKAIDRFQAPTVERELAELKKEKAEQGRGITLRIQRPAPPPRFVCEPIEESDSRLAKHLL